VWQVDANLSSYLSQGGPYRAAIFTRFLEEKLGWQKFQWTLGDGAYEGRVVFLRCADVVDRCDPTIDGSHYETVQVNVAQLARQGPFGIWVVTDWEMLEPFERLADPEEVFRLLNGFIDARVTGAGAQQYLNVPESGVPLLYATSSGASYEHGESTRVLGDWPYDWTPFKVQLFAGSTVVEQLVFVSRDGGHLSLEYVSDGFGTDIAPTTENGRPVATPYNALRDKAILYVSHPWVSRYGKLTIRLIPEGAAPTTDGGERNDWDRLVLIADPTRSGSGCPTGPGPADAEALAESIRSDPGLVATAPVAISTGRAPGVWMDVRLAEQASGVCGGLSGLTELQVSESVDLTSGLRMRLWLFDLPEASSMQIMAVAMVVPESHFERAAAAAASLSVDFSAN
jgi:hypothetical protein